VKQTKQTKEKTQILSVSSTEEMVRHFSGFTASPSSVKSLVSHKM
jgi:hypothetical protein